jgi:hypothetical protein
MKLHCILERFLHGEGTIDARGIRGDFAQVVGLRFSVGRRRRFRAASIAPMHPLSACAAEYRTAFSALPG